MRHTCQEYDRLDELLELFWINTGLERVRITEEINHFMIGGPRPFNIKRYVNQLVEKGKLEVWI